MPEHASTLWNRSLKCLFSGEDRENSFPNFFSDTEKNTQPTQNNSLYEMVEQIIALFDLGMWQRNHLYSGVSGLGL